MDKRKLLLLKFLLNNCNEGYKVIETSKFYSAIKKYKGNFAWLESDIDYLKRYKYIDLKYIDDNNVCLSIMDNSRILQENIKVERNLAKQMKLYMVITMIVSGLLSFVGAFVAVLLR